MEEKIEIRVAQGFEDVLEVLNTYSSFLASLRNNSDLSSIALKLCDLATTIELVDGARRIGFAVFYCNDLLGRTAYLSRLAVASMYERHGYGSILLEEVISSCKKQGMASLRLEVNIKNQHAIEFYEKHSFIEDGESKSGFIYMSRSL